MQITISGAIGSGKSTVARILAERLGYHYYSLGRFMRDMAQERGMSINEFSKIAEHDREIDRRLDEKQVALGKEHADFILDSRLGFHFLPGTFKIFLAVDVNEAAKRIMAESRKDEEAYKTTDEAIAFIRRRAKSESKRYKDYYGILFPDEKAFDLVIDTTSIPPEQVVERIVAAVNRQ